MQIKFIKSQKFLYLNKISIV